MSSADQILTYEHQMLKYLAPSYLIATVTVKNLNDLDFAKIILQGRSKLLKIYGAK